MKTPIKTASGVTRGYIVETGDRKTLTDLAGKTLGWYDKNTNKTFDKSGRPVYDGDMTSVLLT